jgi:hypothetical protein
LIAAYVLTVAYVSAGAGIALDNPSLPAVDISGVKDVDGALLTHTEGFWYVFDVAGEHKGELIALRDDQVTAVTITSENTSSEGD